MGGGLTATINVLSLAQRHSVGMLLTISKCFICLGGSTIHVSGGRVMRVGAMNVRRRGALRRRRAKRARRRRRAVSSLILAVAAGALRGSSARAVDKFYVGPNAGFWDTSANWSPSGQPTTGDNVLVSSSLVSPSITVTADSITPPTSTNLAQLIIDSPSLFGITVNQTGTRISETNAYVGYTNGGTLTISGTASHSVGFALYFGDLSGSRGFGTLAGAANLTVGVSEWG